MATRYGIVTDNGTVLTSDTFPVASGNDRLVDSILTQTSTTVTVAGKTVMNSVRVAVSVSPASTASGNPGDLTWDTGFGYICVGTSTWARFAITTGY